MVYNVICRSNPIKVRLKTVAVESKYFIWKRHPCKNVRKLVFVDIYCLKAGRLCHLIPVLMVGRGGGYYGKIHIKNYNSNYCVFNSAYGKSKIAPTGQVRAI